MPYRLNQNLVENGLQPTGEFSKREDFYDGSSMRIQVDKSGRGKVVL